MQRRLGLLGIGIAQIHHHRHGIKEKMGLNLGQHQRRPGVLQLQLLLGNAPVLLGIKTGIQHQQGGQGCQIHNRCSGFHPWLNQNGHHMTETVKHQRPAVAQQHLLMRNNLHQTRPQNQYNQYTGDHKQRLLNLLPGDGRDVNHKMMDGIGQIQQQHRQQHRIDTHHLEAPFCFFDI